MLSGWPFSLHTPFPDRWGFEPSIDYQTLPGQKPGVFTECLRAKNRGADFVVDLSATPISHKSYREH